ncbi:hypothetical protein [Hymenobacter rubripertinctus]|nr:hypothetical protein [Hymenobacter rubripertinctus]
MRSVIITEGQSLLDICIQELGSIEALMELADANGLAITDDLETGEQLQIPDSLLSRPEVAAYFAARRQRINTANYPAPPTAPATAGLIDWLDEDFIDNDWF